MYIFDFFLQVQVQDKAYLMQSFSIKLSQFELYDLISADWNTNIKLYVNVFI